MRSPARSPIITTRHAVVSPLGETTAISMRSTRGIKRTLTPPWGLFGGHCGEAAKAWVKQDAQDPGAWLTKRPNYPLKKDGSVTYFTAGGGGYGSAAERPPELVERDRRLGYVGNE